MENKPWRVVPGWYWNAYCYFLHYVLRNAITRHICHVANGQLFLGLYRVVEKPEFTAYIPIGVTAVGPEALEDHIRICQKTLDRFRQIETFKELGGKKI